MDLNSKMKVIAHQAEGMNAVAESLNARLQQKEKAGSIRLVEENVLAAVAAEDDVVDGAGKVKAGFTGHSGIL